MNRDELEGKAEALKGRIKQAAGDLTNDPDLHDEGVVDEAAGQTQDTACRLVGISRRTLWAALRKGQDQSGGIHREFYDRYEKARAQAARYPAAPARAEADQLRPPGVRRFRQARGAPGRGRRRRR